MYCRELRLLETEEIVEKKIDSQQGAKFLYSCTSHFRVAGIGKSNEPPGLWAYQNQKILYFKLL